MRAITLALTLTALAAAGSANAATYAFNAFLSGAAEAPPNVSPGSGFGKFMFDDTLHTMMVEITFEDLLGPTTAAHVHGPTAVAGEGTASVATTTPTFTGFPGGVTFGSYSHTFDMTLSSSYNPGFLNNPTNMGSTATAEQTLINAALAGKAYLNIHTSAFGAGEIRGFLARVPEPATWALMLAGFGLAGTALRARRRVQAS